MGNVPVTKADIIQGLRSLGLRIGDLVQVHSSMKSFGYVEGGPDAVLDALLEVVGAHLQPPQGTVMMPTFNHGAVEIFDIKNTPSRNGLLTETLRLRPNARRSMHPTHPYAAIGKDAEWLTEGHLQAGTFGVDSPLGKLAQKGGYVLMLGAPFSTCTAAHIGEYKARVPCIGWWQMPRKILLPDGSILAVRGDIWRNGPCRIEWDPLETRLRSRNLISQTYIGPSRILLMRAQDVIDVTYEMTQELCPTCPTRPRSIG